MVYPGSVFITGANRGIGLGLVREFLKVPVVEKVFAGCRNPDSAKDLNAIDDARLKIVKVDVENDKSINDAYSQGRSFAEYFTSVDSHGEFHGAMTASSQRRRVSFEAHDTDALMSSLSAPFVAQARTYPACHLGRDKPDSLTILH
ncbi:unnamed protein product [Nippostrongylus brasiliensis]|uniref:LD36273p (inferred by orthology to a D. melanogaster protein) n=1 Tax=Nippostrongylus brasiliensis TaxID=27835 RepID=A0A0N4YQG6_NIPBR|nr:unnamed protein product [Nippostrongylus brasiliensis]